MKGERSTEMRKFLNEYQFATGRNGPLVQSSLADVPMARIVCMPKDVLVRFRNDYLLLVRFSAHACNVAVEDLCPFDLLAPFLREAMEEVRYADES